MDEQQALQEMVDHQRQPYTGPKMDVVKWKTDLRSLELELKAHAKLRREPPGNGPSKGDREVATCMYALRAYRRGRGHGPWTWAQTQQYLEEKGYLDFYVLQEPVLFSSSL